MLILLAALAAASPVDGLDRIYPQLDALYVDLHKNPVAGKAIVAAAEGG